MKLHESDEHEVKTTRRKAEVSLDLADVPLLYAYGAIQPSQILNINEIQVKLSERNTIVERESRPAGPEMMLI